MQRPWMGVTVAALALAALAACATNPATGERQLTLVSEAQEIELGRVAREQIEQTIGLVPDDALQTYVDRLGQQLARASERPDLPWSFQVVDDPTPNAFALPGGFIYLTRGMLNLMDSEAELVTVLGHEIAHVTARHSVAALTRQQLAQLGLGIGGLLFPELRPFGSAASAGLDLLLLRYGRDAEREADELGFGYALAQGYDVAEMADVFRALQRIDPESRSALPSWLTTHPLPAERIEQVDARVRALPGAADAARLGRAEYLARIDGLVYGEDPRDGYFTDEMFVHPDLQFRLGVPDGWEGENLTRAVLLLNPNRTAAAQLTLAGTAPPAAAAQRFFDQRGVRAGRLEAARINGIPAVVAPFEASTDQGVLRGIVAWLDYDELTYQLVAYAPAASFARHQRTLQAIVESFAPLTDPEALAVEPLRMDIVRIDRAMTLADFARAYASAVPPDTLAVLNQVPGAQTTLPAGTLVKRVVRGQA